MSWRERFTRSDFFIKLTNWEYWPFGIVQFPAIIYYGWLSVRTKSLTFFTASNPGITMGGMFGESKFQVLRKIPSLYLPKMAFIQPGTSLHEVIDTFVSSELHYPFICKPDIGERGFKVKKIRNEEDLVAYMQSMPFPFIIQEYVDLPLEFGVFYARMPSQDKGKVTSIVKKEMLNIKGNGKETLQQLILKKDRAKLHWKTLQHTHREKLNTVIPANETIELVSIGNHCLGTKFINGNSLITERLSNSFDLISKQIEGFYFGRFDLRCATVKDLEDGNVKVMELNGCGAEPAHIYDPGFSFFTAIRVLLKHWHTIFLIARENINLGHTYTSMHEARIHYATFKNATKN